MSDHTPEFTEGDAWTDEQTGKEFEVKEVETEYVVSVTQYDSEGNRVSSERVRYPEDSLKRRVGEDTMSAKESAEDADSDSESVSCPECDRTFDTERGLAVHRAQAHADGAEG